MQTLQADYFSAYHNLKLTRDAKGVLVAEFLLTLFAMWPTRLRNTRAVPQLNQPPCRWRIAAPFRTCAGMAHQPEMPPTVSPSKVTPSGYRRAP